MNGKPLEQNTDYTTSEETQSLAPPHYCKEAFFAAAGSGWTVASLSRFLQSMNPLAYDRMCSTGNNPNIKCFLIDPPGSSLIKKVTGGGGGLKNPFDTMTEGLGKYRLAQNFMMAKLDETFKGTDLKGVEMSWFLLKNDGLFLGSSLAMNCVRAVRHLTTQSIGPGHTIVSCDFCDGGMSHLSKFYSA
ncbi:hypothetical protein ACB092_06G029800 [Castanea dentata]